MATNPRLPPCPQVPAAGFQDPVGSKWLDLIRQRGNSLLSAVFGASGGVPAGSISHDNYSQYTPVVVATGGGTFTSAVVTGAWMRIGNFVFLQLTLNVVNVGTAVGPLTFSLPFMANGSPGSGLQVVPGRENGSTGSMMQFLIGVNGTVGLLRTYDNLAPLASGYNYQINGR